MPTPEKLSELPAGQCAVIAGMTVDKSSLTRLRELGLVPGTHIRVVRRAPLGEPIEIMVRGSLLAMRNHDASHISIVDVAS